MDVWGSLYPLFFIVILLNTVVAENHEVPPLAIHDTGIYYVGAVVPDRAPEDRDEAAGSGIKDDEDGEDEEEEAARVLSYRSTRHPGIELEELFYFLVELHPTGLAGRVKRDAAKHGSPGTGRGRGEHKRGHHTGHRGHWHGLQRKHRWNQMPKEKRLSIVCWNNRRLVEAIHNKYTDGVGNVDRKHKLLVEVAEKIGECCKNNISNRVKCFEGIQHMQADKFCDGDMPPWARGNPRIYKKVQKFKNTCCSTNGPARYKCFDRIATHNAPDEDVKKFEEGLADSSEEDDDFGYDADTDQSLDEHSRKSHDLKKQWNHLCCRAGNTFVPTSEKLRRRECASAGRTFASMMGHSRDRCVAIFERCCLGTDGKARNDEDVSGDAPGERPVSHTMKFIRYDRPKAWKAPGSAWKSQAEGSNTYSAEVVDVKGPKSTETLLERDGNEDWDAI